MHDSIHDPNLSPSVPGGESSSAAIELRRAGTLTKKEYAQQWYAKNRERVLAERKKQYREDGESIRKKSLTYYHTNKEKVIERTKAWRVKNAEAIAQRRHARYTANIELSRKQASTWRAKRISKKKIKAFLSLGGKCVDCGIDNYEVLQIDHINNDGCIERKQLGLQYEKMLSNIIDGNSVGKYQLLCANCNWIKEKRRRAETRRHE